MLGHNQPVNKKQIMPAAICNDCSTLIPLKVGEHIRKKFCECGSNNLSAVAGKWNDEQVGFDYFDRKGDLRLHVPQVTFQDDDEPEFIPCDKCDGHPACEDFGCAFDLGLGKMVAKDNI